MMISIRDLNISFGSGKNEIQALKGVNLDVAEGTAMALLASPAPASRRFCAQWWAFIPTGPGPSASMDRS